MSYIKIEGLKKSYKTGKIVNNVLRNVNLEIEEGELVVIYGPSGAGKTTLLNIIGGLDKADEGKIVVGNKEITKYNSKQLNEYTKNNIGFVFQFYNLIQNLTALDNIKIASELVGKRGDEIEILKKLNMFDKKDKMPFELSGGEQQRIVIARAIAKKTKILLCDEPIGALDYENGKNILQVLQDICKQEKITVIIVTHNLAINEMADKVVFMKNGKIEKVENNKNIKSAKDLIW